MPTIGSILNPLRQKCPAIRYFRWDKNKARANIRKHGIDFDTASLLFRDPFSVRKLDRITAEGEILWHTFGMVQGNMLLIVTPTTTDEDGNEYVRAFPLCLFTVILKREALKNLMENTRKAAGDASLRSA